MKNLIPLAGIFILATSCTRPEPDGISSVQIQTPRISGLSSKVGALSEPVPAGKEVCFGIQVTGNGIGTTPGNMCSPSLGIYTGFVKEGSALSVMVPQGTARKFELFAHLVNTGESCPLWNESFNSTGTPYTNVFSVGTAEDVTIAGEKATVSINFAFPGESNHVASALSLGTCTPVVTASLKGVLYSNGDIENASGAKFIVGAGDPSFATNQSFYKILGGQNDVSGLKVMSHAHVLNETTTLQIPFYISSVTKKPDSAKIYGLMQNGVIVEIDSSTGAPIDIAGSCPFKTCAVPPWIQSISAGNGDALYALDHAGQIYLALSLSNLTLTGTVVNPAVTQVSFY